MNEMSCVNMLTLGDLYVLHEQGFEFLIEDGVIADVVHR